MIIVQDNQASLWLPGDNSQIFERIVSSKLFAAALGNSYNALVEGNKRIWKKAKVGNILAPRALQDNFEELCTRSYPLHPTVLVLLPALFKRFGQNERSLFSFLSADEPHSLSDWLQDQVFNRNAPPFYNLSDLHDYTYHNLKQAR